LDIQHSLWLCEVSLACEVGLLASLLRHLAGLCLEGFAVPISATMYCILAGQGFSGWHWPFAASALQ
jgi:hypothetical protein